MFLQDINMKYKTNGKLTSKQKTSIKLYIKEKEKKKSLDHTKHEEESVSRLDRTSKYLPGKPIALFHCVVLFFFLMCWTFVPYLCPTLVLTNAAAIVLQLGTTAVRVSQGLSKYDVALVRELAWRTVDVSAQLNGGSSGGGGGSSDRTEEVEHDIDVASRLVFLPRAAKKGTDMLGRKRLKEIKHNMRLVADKEAKETSSTTAAVVPLAQGEKIAAVLELLRQAC